MSSEFGAWKLTGMRTMLAIGLQFLIAL